MWQMALLHHATAIGVDAWRWTEFGFIDGLMVRTNQRVNNALYGVSFFFSTKPGVARIVDGSVKMGQAIQHPLWRFSAEQEQVSGGANTFLPQHGWFRPSHGGTAPVAPYLVMVCAFNAESGRPVRAISPIVEWPKLPLRTKFGGYP